MMVGHKHLSISDHKTADENKGYNFSTTSRLAEYDGVTEQKPSNGILAPMARRVSFCSRFGHFLVPSERVVILAVIAKADIV
jgi:hypothetical protein